MPDLEKNFNNLRIFRTYFPKVGLSPVITNNYKNDYYIGNLPEILGNYIDGTFLNIPGMAKSEIFKPLFPRKINEQNELKKIMNNPQDAIDFFLSKIDKPFTSGLNEHLEEEDKISPGTIKEMFYEEGMICQYSMVEKDNGDLEDKFVWDFSNCEFSHSITSVYDDAFYYYAKRNCSLYLFGTEFLNFKENSDDWPYTPGENRQPVPVYLSNGEFGYISAGDFVIAKPGVRWTVESSKQYLLKLFEIDENLNISLKNIYYSFCIPQINMNKYSKPSDKKQIIECGWDVIKSTLGKIEPVNRQIPEYPINMEDKLWEKIKFVKKQISKYGVAWVKILNEKLESSAQGADDDYCPTVLEIYIEKVAGEIGLIKNKTIKLFGEEGIKEEVTKQGYIKMHEFPIDHKRHQNIYSLYGEKEKEQIRSILSEKKLDSFNEVCRHGNDFEKIEKLRDLINAYQEIKNIYQKRLPTIEYLHQALQNKISLDDSGKNEDETTSPLEIEDKSRLHSLDRLIAEVETEKNREKEEQLKQLVIECFERGFRNLAEKWISYIQGENLNVLSTYLKDYPPRSMGNIGRAIDSNLFKKFCEVLHLNITDAGAKRRVHTNFANQMRNVTDRLEEKLQDICYK